VEYFVKQGFEREVHGRFGDGAAWIEELEARVEADKYSELRSSCRAELSSQRRSAQAARVGGDARSLRSAVLGERRACRALHETFPDLGL